VPYYQEVLVAAPRRTLVEAALRKAITNTEGIESLKSFSVAYDTAARTMSPSFTVVSEDGEISISEVLS
jgi:hypothetical protein